MNNRLISSGEFIQAAQNGDMSVIEQYIANNGSNPGAINVTDQNGATALIWAAIYGHTAAVQALINAGAKIDTANKQDRTALILAAYGGYAATVQALIDAGAEIRQYYIGADASDHPRSIERKAAKIIITAKINNIHKQRLANGNKPKDIINALNEQTKYEYDFLKHIYRELFYTYDYDNQYHIHLKKLMSLAKHLYEGLGYDSAEAVRFLTTDLDAMPDNVKALASDLLAYLERKKKPSIYINAIEQALNELKNDIASATFHVKDIKGNWVPGKPRHIATIESILNRQRKTWADTLGTYSKVMTLLDTEASIFQKNRHPNTTLFYKDSLEKLRGIRYDGSNSYTPMPPSYEDHMKMHPNSYDECMRSNPASPAAAAAVDLTDLLPPPTYTNDPAHSAAAATSPAPAIKYDTQTFAALFPPVPTSALPALPSERPAEKRMLSA